MAFQCQDAIDPGRRVLRGLLSHFSIGVIIIHANCVIPLRLAWFTLPRTCSWMQILWHFWEVRNPSFPSEQGVQLDMAPRVWSSLEVLKEAAALCASAEWGS